MKKCIGSIAWLLLLCLLGALLLSCGAEKEKAPDGMQAANLAGDDFRLYVPMTWTLNTAYGTAGAYASAEQQSSVSTVKYLRDAAMYAEMEAAGCADAPARMYYFWQTRCFSVMEGREAVRDISLPEDSTLGGLPAKQFRYDVRISGELYRMRHVVVERTRTPESGEEVSYYVVTFMYLAGTHEQISATVDAILDAFVFSETGYRPEEVAKVPGEGKDTPAGMKKASNRDVAYDFYVPESWSVTVDHEVFSAYVEGDRTNVSVVPYLPSVDGYQIENYYTDSVNAMKQQLGEHALTELENAECTLGGKPARSYRFTLEIGGETYHYAQVTAKHKGMIYCVTYTASAEATYRAHENEWKQILGAFTFR